MEYPIITIVWTCVALFVITGAITLLGLVGLVTLGGNQPAHEYYLKVLFKTLIVELVVISLGTFASSVTNRADNSALNKNLTSTLEGLETRIRTLEIDFLQKK